MASTSLEEKFGRERWADASRGRRDAPLVMMVDLLGVLVKDDDRSRPAIETRAERKDDRLPEESGSLSSILHQ
ncbi:hypothetical protein [Mesorhizobium sp. CO1-1-8]|uniref:hypothetical protein n=1 Tax=Mesorhizobium sp. CO1-1-8 TaxID=2876631 RepID=UPI001CD087A4|nr:hypothetical protein [Mesorhizobium sp. CO1-1-8]MBZ9774541.1 hypothetical protein [Mesorhizobium sp. CO1-1-8]